VARAAGRAGRTATASIGTSRAGPEENDQAAAAAAANAASNQNCGRIPST